VERKAFLSSVLLVVFGATHQAVNSRSQSQARTSVPAPRYEESGLCQTLQWSLYGEAPSSPEEAQTGRCFARSQDILFIIATAPNPANSQLALSFDRTIDSIERAAGDRGFLFDRFSYPWDAEPQNPQADPDKYRKEEQRRKNSEAKPGMLLFRNNVSGDDPLSHYRRLAVLLVAENPSSGVNEQAFEAAATFVSRNAQRAEPVLVLGPSFSSSAASLRSVMDLTHLHYLIRTGSATVPSAWLELGRGLPDAKGRPVFQSTLRSDDDAARALFQHLEITGEWHGEWQKQGRIATLSESGTLYGAYASEKNKVESREAGEEKGQDFEDTTGHLNIVFPRGISWLRNAYQDMPTSTAVPPGLPTPVVRLLPFAISEAMQGDDKPPSLSGTQTPISEEAALLNIATTLRRERVRFVVITGTDPLDNIFLMRFLRTHCPDLRIITFEADLLYVRAATEFPATGVILVTTYPLFTRNQYWTKSRPADDRVQFVSMGSEGTYNACRALLVAAADDQVTPDDVLFDYRDPFQRGLRKPPVWLTVTTPNGYWPLALLSDPDLISRQPEGAAQKSEESPSELLLRWPPGQPNTGARSGANDRPFAEDVSRLWYLVAVVLLAVCGLMVGLMSGRAGWRRAPLFRRFAPRELGEQSPGRAFFRCVIAIGLSMLAILLAWPVLALRHNGPSRHTLVVACVLAAEAFVLVILSAITQFPQIVKATIPATRIYTFMTAFAVLVFVGSLTGWSRVLSGGLHHEGFFAAYRSLDLVNGVAPNVPFGLLALAILCGAWVHLKRLDLYELSPHTVPSLGTGILDAAQIARFDEARQGVNRALSLPFSYPPLVYVAAIAGPAAFYLIMREYTQSLELHSFDLLFGCIFTVAVMMVVLTAARLVVIWTRFRNMLRVVAIHPIREWFGKLQLEGKWGPILHRSLAPEELAARERELLRKLYGGREYPAGMGEQSLRENALDPQWLGGASVPEFDAAAELFALQYARFIQPTCRQMENLLVGAAVTFVVILIALNSYPFHSSHVLGWFMANLLILLGVGAGFVLAGTERDPILSLMNQTTPGKIGKDFYLNLLSYGALPLLTVLAVQFPSVGQFLFSWVQPMLQALRG
jgi:hypothetical protein